MNTSNESETPETDALYSSPLSETVFSVMRDHARRLETRLAAAEAEVERLRGLFNRLLPKVNKVTSPHRHGMKPTARAMDDLSDRQLEIEEALAPLYRSAPAPDAGVEAPPPMKEGE